MNRRKLGAGIFSISITGMFATIGFIAGWQVVAGIGIVAAFALCIGFGLHLMTDDKEGPK